MSRSSPPSTSRRTACLLATGLFFLCCGTFAQTDDLASLNEAEAEQRLTALKTAILELTSQLENSRSLHRSEQAELKQLDLAIQQTTRQLRELDQQITAHLQELESLERSRDEQIRTLQSQQEQLAGQVNATYRLASQSRVKLVLNQDDPSQLSRMLAYYNHINQVQVEKINGLKKLLQELEQVFQAIETELKRIKTVQNDYNLVLEQQNKQRGDRQDLLTTLSQQISTGEGELKELERNRADLEQLLERLGDALADIPSDLGAHLGVAAQKGKLSLPVAGRVLHGYGQKRAAGMHWQGWLLQAKAGQEVHNIAYGRVAFADWLRGYGLLMIIDHGQGFLSLYGYNESLLWEVGDWVEPGTIIATVGDSPAGEQGLYFELRKDGKALDPAAWLQR